MECVRQLLAAGADANARQLVGAACVACGVLKGLLQWSACGGDARGRRCRAPWARDSHAHARKRLSSVTTFTLRSARLTCTQDGGTALFLAAQRTQQPAAAAVVGALLHAGADVNAAKKVGGRGVGRRWRGQQEVACV